MKLNVVRIDMPGAVFSGAAALVEFADDAELYLQAVRNYAATGDDVMLQINLEALGYDGDAIEWHISRPGKIMPQGFASSQD